jgi:hypothetical protein
MHESKYAPTKDWLNITAGAETRTLFFPNCKVVFNCSHLVVLTSSFEIEDRLFPCHLSWSSLATSRNKTHYRLISNNMQSIKVIQKHILWTDFFLLSSGIRSSIFWHLSSDAKSCWLSSNLSSKKLLRTSVYDRLWEQKLECQLFSYHNLCWTNIKLDRVIKTYARKGWRTSPVKDIFFDVFSPP